MRHWNINEATKIDHPYYFTEDSVEVLFAKTGFEPIHKIVSEDKLHILYICRPTIANANYLLNPSDVKDYLKEIRLVQGTSWEKK